MLCEKKVDTESDVSMEKKGNHDSRGWGHGVDVIVEMQRWAVVSEAGR